MGDAGNGRLYVEAAEALRVPRKGGGRSGVGGLVPCGLSGAALSPGCAADSFKCDNGKCVPNAQKCDGKDNCGDGSDEGGCSNGEEGLWQGRPLKRSFVPVSPWPQ